MKHPKAGEETIQTLNLRVPERITIDGQMSISFRDVFFNLILNNLKQVDFGSINKKIHNVTTQAMSPKHRKRILKQLRKNAGLK